MINRLKKTVATYQTNAQLWQHYKDEQEPTIGKQKCTVLICTTHTGLYRCIMTSVVRWIVSTYLVEIFPCAKMKMKTSNVQLTSNLNFFLFFLGGGCGGLAFLKQLWKAGGSKTCNTLSLLFVNPAAVYISLNLYTGRVRLIRTQLIQSYHLIRSTNLLVIDICCLLQLFQLFVLYCNSNFHLIRNKILPMKHFELTGTDLYNKNISSQLWIKWGLKFSCCSMFEMYCYFKIPLPLKKNVQLYPFWHSWDSSHAHDHNWNWNPFSLQYTIYTRWYIVTKIFLLIDCIEKVECSSPHQEENRNSLNEI